MWTIVRGNALHLPLADRSVQCVVTSPPYWGLRVYAGVQPSVWGGDPECEHDWDVACYRRRSNDDKGGGKQLTNVGSTGRDVPIEYATCSHCGAWYGCLGLEPTPGLYVQHLVEVFREVWRVLRPDGTLWLNLGDTYNSNPSWGRGRSTLESRRQSVIPPKPAGGWYDHSKTVDLKSKDLVGIPWRVAFALQAEGWYLRSDIIWAKGLSFCPAYSGSVMPESVADRPTSAYEHVFLLSKSVRYYYDNDAVREPQAGYMYRGRGGLSKADYENRKWTTRSDGLSRPPMTMNNRQYHAAGRNLRNVWAINPSPFRGAHFATFPPALVECCIKAGTSECGCCPHCGAPWERVVEREALGERDDTGRTHGLAPQRLNSPGAPPERGWQAAHTTIGWQPTCDCPEHDPVPCVVLDPFAGAGTTLLVADRLGRHGVGVELSGEYCDMARKRCYQDAPLLAWTRGQDDCRGNAGDVGRGVRPGPSQAFAQGEAGYQGGLAGVVAEDAPDGAPGRAGRGSGVGLAD